jgi:SIT4-associating protein SAP185/190
MARFGEAISPPDPALIAAATEDEPLGPGVSGDTHIRGGMLERRMDDGEIVQVPQDEVVRGVEDAMERRTESGSETETGDP